MKIAIYFLYIFLVKGEVINQTFKKPESNVEVYLYEITQEGTNLIDSTISGKKGTFQFESGEGMYLLKAFYKNSIFRENPVLIKKDTSLVLSVWELTESTDGMEISRVHIAVLPEKDGITVTEVISFNNFNNKAFYKPFGIELPSKIKSFSPFSGIFPDEVHLTDNKLLYYLPLVPGKQVISFQYLVPESFEFKRTFPFRTELFEIFVSPELKVEGYGKGESQQIGEKKYRRFVLQNIQANKEVFFKVTKSKKLINLKDIFPVLIVLIFIAIFLIYRWKKK